MQSSTHNPQLAHGSSPPVNKGEPFVTQIGWKDENELQDFVRTIHSLLVYGEPPQNGWTWYKFNKAVYNTIKASSTRTVRLESEYQEVWLKLRSHFLTWLVGKDVLASPGISNSVLKLLEEIKLHIAGHSHAFDIFAEEKLRVWNCDKWMFPIQVAEKFPVEEKGGSPPHSGLARHSSSEANKDKFIGAPLMVANSQLPLHMAEIWDFAGEKFCADGGANRVFDWFHSKESLKEAGYFIPSAIVGDLDSVRPDVQSSYESKGSKIIKKSSQDDTDLDKTLAYFDSLPQFASSTHIMITGALGGNVSQEFANYHSCWKHNKRQIAFIADSGLVLYLAPGRHLIRSAMGLKCGILPLGEPCATITTTGLKWNLDHDEMQFGGLISSSNVTVSPSVTVENSHPVLWTFDCAS
jgi:thiamine pyrophosphokinase